MTETDILTYVEQNTPSVGCRVERSRVKTYDVIDGVQKGRTRDDGEYETVEITTVHLTVGRTTCSFGLTHGDGSPDTWVPRTDEDITTLILSQAGNAAREHSKKPRTAKDVHDEINRLIAANRARARDEERSRRAAMPAPARERADYIQAYGEPSYLHVAEDGGDPLEALKLAIELGSVSDEEAKTRRAALVAWKHRSEKNTT